MSFFQRILFKARQSFRSKEPGIKRKTLLELFKTDFSKVPDDTFEQAFVDIDNVGTNLPAYYKKLEYKECGLFDDIEIVKFSEEDFNVCFTTYDVHNINPLKLIKLVDRLAGIFGPDKDDKTTFTIRDFTHLQEGYWTGRSWPGDGISGKNKVHIDLLDARLQLSLVLSRVKIIPSSDSHEKLMNLL